MSCPGYVPPFLKQLDGSAFAGVNCTAASAAMAVAYDTCGREIPSPSQVRRWTGDTSGGLTLAQVDQAVNDKTTTDLDVRYRMAWTDFVRYISNGRLGILQGWYSPIRASRFRGSETFGGNHAMPIPPDFAVLDPLADGRRPGIYKYHRETYPLSLLKDFAARLNIGGSSYRPIGLGLVYVAFTRDNEPNFRAQLPLTRFWVYTVENGVVQGRKPYSRGAGSSVPCTAPRLYRWPGHSSKSLVKVTKGIYIGRYVSTQYAEEV